MNYSRILELGYIGTTQQPYSKLAWCTALILLHEYFEGKNIGAEVVIKTTDVKGAVPDSFEFDRVVLTGGNHSTYLWVKHLRGKYIGTLYKRVPVEVCTQSKKIARAKDTVRREDRGHLWAELHNAIKPHAKDSDYMLGIFSTMLTKENPPHDNFAMSLYSAFLFR